MKYYLLPDFSKFSFMTVCAAMGQMFFSMSPGHGNHDHLWFLHEKGDEPDQIRNQIEICDTVVALLAGFMVVPAVYMFSGEAGTKASGAGLMFVTLPKVFGEMRGGQFIGLLFLRPGILRGADQFHLGYGGDRILPDGTGLRSAV